MKLGTRGSALALAQAKPIASALDAEIVVVKTSGDRGTSEPSDKQRWVDAIEQALLDERIDLAVHSAKDVPGELADGLELVAATGREDPTDALIGAKSLSDLAPGARVGTSSPRRRAQLLAARADIEVVTISGNVDTRLAKLSDGQADAIVLATAGLKRLGLDHAIGAILDPAVFVPAPGQGTLAIEARAGFDASSIADELAFESLLAERELAALLGASCTSAVGIHCDGDRMSAWVGSSNGSIWVRDAVTNGSPSELAARMEAMGALELIS
jgi:hydroxymethylbilane synthase